MPMSRDEKRKANDAKFGKMAPRIGADAINQAAASRNEEARKKVEAKQQASAEFLTSRKIGEMYKKEVLKKPESPKAPEKLNKKYLSEKLNYLNKRVKYEMGIIAHKFPKKERKPQLEVLERLIERANKGDITRGQMYGGLLYIHEKIGKTNFKSRLDTAIRELCAEIQKEQPDLKQKALAEHAIMEFKALVGASPSLAKGNVLLEKIKKDFETEKQSAQAVKSSVVMTGERIEKTMNVIKGHMAHSAAHQLGSLGMGGSALSEEYNQKKGWKGRMFQSKASQFTRMTQMVDLEKAMGQLYKATTLSDKDKAHALVGCLLQLKEQIQAEKPKDKKHFEKSTMGKMVGNLLKEIGIPEDVQYSSKQAQRFKEKYEKFKGGELVPPQVPPRNRM